MNTYYALTAVSAVAIGWMFWRIMRMPRRRNANASARSSEVTITWLGSYSAAFQRALDIFGILEIELVDADPNRGTIVGRAGLAALGAGSLVRIALRTQEGVTTVTVTVGSSLVEVGQSQRLGRRFVEVWDRLPDPAPAVDG